MLAFLRVIGDVRALQKADKLASYRLDETAWLAWITVV